MTLKTETFQAKIMVKVNEASGAYYTTPRKKENHILRFFSFA